MHQANRPAVNFIGFGQRADRTPHGGEIARISGRGRRKIHGLQKTASGSKHPEQFDSAIYYDDYDYSDQRIVKGKKPLQA
jgi:hypothetical protein